MRLLASYSNRVEPQNMFEALFLLIRPVESISVGIALIVAYFMANPVLSEIDWVTILFIFISGYFISAQGMVHNDIVDLEADKINCPHRALPSGVVSVKTAQLYVVVLASISLLFALLIDIRTGYFPYSLLYALVFIILLDSYNYYFKKRGIIGNFIIGFSVTNLFFYGDILVHFNEPSPITVIPAVVGIAALFINLGREIIKAMSDVEGDADQNIRSVAVTLGFSGAAILGSTLIMFGLVITSIVYMVPSIRADFHPISIVVLVAVQLAMVSLLIKLWRSFTPENAFWVKERIFYVMMLILLPFAIQVVINYL